MQKNRNKKKSKIWSVRCIQFNFHFWAKFSFRFNCPLYKGNFMRKEQRMAGEKYLSVLSRCLLQSLSALHRLYCIRNYLIKFAVSHECGVLVSPKNSRIDSIIKFQWPPYLHIGGDFATHSRLISAINHQTIVICAAETSHTILFFLFLVIFL